MALSRQNRTIWILATVVFLMLMTFLIRDGKLEDLTHAPTPEGLQSEKASGNEELFGDKVGEAAVAIPGEGQRLFAETLKRLSQCFQTADLDETKSSPLQIETVLQTVERDFGPPTHQSDNWMNWHLRTREGKERRLSLEITESDDGKVGRELHYFALDRDGQPMPIELEPSKAMNPSDEVISQMLKEGEVFYKERAASVFFSNHERIEYIEKNGELSEISVIKDIRQFRCTNVKVPENCQCQ